MNKYAITLSVEMKSGKFITLGNDDFSTFATVKEALKAVENFRKEVDSNSGLYPEVTAVYGGTIYETDTDKIVKEF